MQNSACRETDTCSASEEMFLQKGTRSLVPRVNRCPLRVSILSKINPLHNDLSYSLLKSNSLVCHAFVLLLVSFRFPLQKSVCISYASYTCHVSYPVPSPSFYQPDDISCRSHFRNHIQSPVTSPLIPYM